MPDTNCRHEPIRQMKRSIFLALLCVILLSPLALPWIYAEGPSAAAPASLVDQPPAGHGVTDINWRVNFWGNPIFIGSVFILLVISLIVAFTLYYRDLEEQVTERTESLHREIRDRMRIEEDLRRHKEQIELINKILRHDIVNNLQGIQSAMNLYEDEKDSQFIEAVYTYIDKSVNLIQNMKATESMLQADDSRIIVDILGVINKIKPLYPAVSFMVKGKALVWADDSLVSVFDNIISNAIIHGKADRISITISGTGDECEIRFADNGCGIHESAANRIFDEGYSHGESGRTGMGLYIVKKTAESYGGSVAVENTTPQGATFILKLKQVNRS